MERKKREGDEGERLAYF
ncbi:unnamed protein product [Tuber melanosporum]|uniref:(Perigord truffle) hypothetical protein n=1 Tax=Tuber melanosporum (strain Mel28) TaxID=656061 RepID=D5GL23_TUBMM|nr:unnamed protein product [Tuber melanosporum]